jgi:hypothetical protein
VGRVGRRPQLSIHLHLRRVQRGERRTGMEWDAEVGKGIIVAVFDFYSVWWAARGEGGGAGDGAQYHKLHIERRPAGAGGSRRMRGRGD